MTTVSFRQARPKDAERLYELKRASFPSAYLDLSVFRSPKSTAFLRALAGPVLSPRHPMLVAGDFEGYVQGVIRERSIHLSFIGVRPDLEGRGLGRDLLDAFENLGRAAGCDRATLDVFESNAKASPWYDRRGYREISRSEMVLVGLEGVEPERRPIDYVNRTEALSEENARGFSMIAVSGGQNEVGIIAGDTLRPKFAVPPVQVAGAMRADFPERTRMILAGAPGTLELGDLSILNREISRRLERAL